MTSAPSGLARLAGETLCVGFPGDAPGPATLAELTDLGPCGVVLFARNVSDRARTTALVDALRGALTQGAFEPLVCVDQEGGRVARLRFGEALPTMLALGAANDRELAARAGARLGRELAEVGANLDFAPVLDLADAPAATVIGTRALGDDPQRVAELGAALVRGVQSVGVAATAKHFPGHGESELDPHIASPKRPAIRERDVLPFAAAFAAGARAVMTAHVTVEQYGDRPATITRAIMTDVLRRDLHFTGVAFTDCLQMDAIAGTVGTPRGAVLALAAGADVVTVSHDLPVARAARDAIVAAVTSGEISRERLEDAVARSRALRADLGRQAGLRASAAADSHADCDVGLAIARAAIVRVRGEVRVPTDRPIAVVSFEGDASDGVARVSAERPSLSLALRRRRLRSELFRVPLAPDAAMSEMLLEVLAAERAQGDRALVVLARRAHLYAQQRSLLRALFALAPDAIAISMLEPFDVPALADARNVLATCGDEQPSIEALADALTGALEPSGALPVKIASAS